MVGCSSREGRDDGKAIRDVASPGFTSSRVSGWASLCCRVRRLCEVHEVREDGGLDLSDEQLHGD